MGREHKPRAGSLQYWPRKRARRIYPKVRSWASLDAVKLLGFAGYKVGMTHVIANDTKSTSPTKNMQIALPVTIIECPPLKLYSLRFYKNTVYGQKLVSEINVSKLDKHIERKINKPLKLNENKLNDLKLDDISRIVAVVYTRPSATRIGKKKPEMFEVEIGGNDIKSKFDYAKTLLDKEINVADVFKAGQFVDIHAVTKGKGFQGPIQRFGLALKAAKSEKKKRSGGNLGPWHPSKVSYTVPQHGQMGFHTRTEYNKQILIISNDPNNVNNMSGFRHYGNIKNNFILVKGSVAGTPRRLIRLNESIRNKKSEPVEITYISK